MRQIKRVKLQVICNLIFYSRRRFESYICKNNQLRKALSDLLGCPDYLMDFTHFHVALAAALFCVFNDVFIVVVLT